MTRHERIAVLAHERFPDDARAAIGLIRYGRPAVVAVVDTARRSPVASQLYSSRTPSTSTRKVSNASEHFLHSGASAAAS